MPSNIFYCCSYCKMLYKEISIKDQKYICKNCKKLSS